MTKVVRTHQILVDAPLRTVFDYVSDLRRHPEWSDGQLRIEEITPDPIAVGKEYLSRGEVALQKDRPNTVRIKQYQSPHPFGFIARDPNFGEVSHLFTFTEQNGSVLVSESFYVLNAYRDTSNAVIRVEFGFANGSYQIRARALNDGTTWLNLPWVPLSDAPHAVEFDWKAATSTGANDGVLTLWVDGQPAGELTGIDNDTRRVEQVRLGAVYGVQTGTRGILFLDAFESRRQSFIGPVQ